MRLSNKTMNVCGLMLIWFLLFGSATSESENDDINAETLSKILLNISKSALGPDFLQDEFDRAGFSSKKIFDEPALGDEYVKTLAEKLSERFRDQFDAVRQIKKVLEQTYNANEFQLSSKYSNRFTRCCKVTNLLENDPAFKMPVDHNTICSRISRDAPEVYTVPLHENVLKVMQENKHKGPKWQYFGTEEGTFVINPAHNQNVSCDDVYDNRYRPWYVETATPIAKDLVLVIDRSGSMRANNRMEIAKEAAKTVIDTLNPNDRVGIVVFDLYASKPPGNQAKCYNNELAFATPDNVEYLKSYIDGIVVSELTTNYTAGLVTAFDLIKRTATKTLAPRRKAILFLTDGVPQYETHESILRTIANLNGAMNNSVVLMTFGLGEDLTEAATTLLQNMSMQVYSDPQKGEIRSVPSTTVRSEANLRQALGSYYNQFSVVATERPVVSVPYVDFFGLGLVTSICLPVHDAQGVLKGVTCVDVQMADIIGDIEYFQPGEFSYSFIIDDTGRTLVHPFLPSPFDLNDDAFFLDISDLERETEAEEVISSMKKGNSGSKKLETRIVTPRGDVSQSGVHHETVTARYHWHHIRNTSFSVCLVFTEKDKELAISHTGNAQHFVHNRFDVIEPPNTCNVLNRVATSDTSAVKLTPLAYIDPDRAKSPSADDLQHIANFMTTTNYDYNVFKDGVKETVVLTEKMDNFWKSRSDTLKRNSIWSYVGTYNGVVRIFPGASLAIAYDHTKRDWYDNARAHKDKLVLTPPYEDAWGAGTVISFVHTVLEGKAGIGTHSTSDMIVAVLGLDIKMDYIHFSIQSLFPACGKQYSCFIVDDTGMLIYHETFMDDEQDFSSYHHLSQVEPDIATYLIENDIMKRESCISYGKKIYHHTWKIVLTLPMDDLDSSYQFRFQKIRETNLYFGVKKKSESFTKSCHCIDLSSTQQKQCKRMDPHNCECPCFSSVSSDEYSYCDNSYQTEKENEIPCTPEKAETAFPSPIANEAEKANKLPPCFGVVCSEYTTESACGLVATCSWCQEFPSTEKSCVSSKLCTKGVQTTTRPGVQTTAGKVVDSEESGMPVLIIGASVGSAAFVIVLIVVIVVIVLIKRRRRMRNDSAVLHPSGRTTPTTNHCTGASTIPPSMLSLTPVVDRKPAAYHANIHNFDKPNTVVPMQEEGPSRQDASQQTLQRELPDVPVSRQDIVEEYLTTSRQFLNTK